MIPHRKKLWRDESAADVIGPVEKGERIIAKNGERRVVRGKVAMSKASRVTTLQLLDMSLAAVNTHTLHIPQFSLQLLKSKH